MDYDFEIEKIVAEIKKQKARRVLIQFPDGLKPKATKIVDELRKKINADIMVWSGSNFGGCDLAQVKGIDLLIHFGHVKYR